MKYNLFLLSFFVFNYVSTDAQNNWHNQLDYGIYDVGFKTFHVKDYSRPYIMGTDSENVPRPMQISVWYPATASKTGPPITLGYLLALQESEESLHKISLADALIPSAIYADYFKGDRLEKVFNKPMKSLLDATQYKGKFPLILYGSAQSSSGFDNALICEQLASHGYIVATVASKGAYSRQMTFDEEGALGQSRDLEFLYGYMYNFPNINIQKLGTVGFSLGCLSMVMFSLKNKNVKAMVSLDGSIPNGYPILKSFTYLNSKDFNSNFLGFLGDKGFINNYPLFDDTTFSDIYLLKLKNRNHLDFSSANLRVTKRAEKAYPAYVDMANLTVKFMNHNFYDVNSFDEVVSSYSKDIYSGLRKKKSKGSPEVSKEEFINYINENGIDKGIQIYYDTKNAFPDYKLFEYQAFRDVGFLKMMEKDYNSAIKVYKVLLEAYPNTSDSYRRLGEAYMEIGNYDDALQLINSGLEIDPNSPAMLDIKRIIKEHQKG